MWLLQSKYSTTSLFLSSKKMWELTWQQSIWFVTYFMTDLNCGICLIWWTSKHNIQTSNSDTIWEQINKQYGDNLRCWFHKQRHVDANWKQDFTCLGRHDVRNTVCELKLALTCCTCEIVWRGFTQLSLRLWTTPVGDVPTFTFLNRTYWLPLQKTNQHRVMMEFRNIEHLLRKDT